MARRLTILVSVCFLAGFTGGVAVFSRSGGRGSGASSREDVSKISDRREERPQPASAEEREKLLHELVASDEWPSETKEALVRQLLADPAFINEIHARCVEGETDQVLTRTFAALAEYCPGHLWRVIERLNFDLPQDFRGVEHLMVAMVAAPEDAFATLRASSHMPAEAMKAIVDSAAENPLTAEPLLEALQRDQTFWVTCSLSKDFPVTPSTPFFPDTAAIRTLLDAGMEVPLEWQGEEAAEAETAWWSIRQEGRDWADQGFPLDRLQGASEEFLNTIGWLIETGQTPPPEVYEFLLSRGRSSELHDTLGTLGGRPGDLNDLLAGIHSDLSDLNDRISEVGHSLVENLPGDPEVLRFLERIQDPEERQSQTVEYYTNWVRIDPEGVLEHLPQIGDTALREALMKQIEENRLPPR